MLDWQVESDRIYERASEDPAQRRWRRRRRMRLLLITLAVAAVITVIFGLAAYRIQSFDNQVRQHLIDTAQAEATALRIGDLAAYLALQRSASDVWISEQHEVFRRYQAEKQAGHLRLTGKVLDATVDGLRGRVILEEIYQEIPHRAVWFYWRYADGWRHVPSDYTFWGDERVIEGRASVVAYRALDERLARALAERADRWWAEGCAIFGCAPGSRLRVEIVPNPTADLRWQTNAPAGGNTLLVPSPLAQQVRAPLAPDLPAALEDAIARLVAQRQLALVSNDLQPAPASDALWLWRTLLEWLEWRYTGRGSPAQLGFIQSLHAAYGDPGLAAIARRLTPEANIGVVGQALGQSLEALPGIDWRAFFQWRLDLEKTLIDNIDSPANTQAIAQLQALWDLSDPNAVQLLQARIRRNTEPSGQVQAVQLERGPDGLSRATVEVLIGGRPYLLGFRLVEGNWKRLS